MANISDYAEKAMLDWILGGATPTRPASWFVGLATTAPTDQSSFEIGAGSGYARQTVAFAAAASPAGTSDNVGAMTFGPFSNGATIVGVHIWDTNAAGNQLWQGTLATARTVGTGDSLVIAAGNLDVALA